MQKWIVILADCKDVSSGHLRKENFAEHFSFLRDNFHQIVFSCGLKNVSDGEESSYGGIWMVEAERKQDVQELIEQDPYFQLGLRGKIDIFKAHEGYV